MNPTLKPASTMQRDTAAGPAMSESTRVIYVLTSGLDIGSPIAASLAARGARVAWLSDGTDAPAVDVDERVTRIAASFASRAELELAFAAAAECVGAPDQVVVSALPPSALVERGITEVTAATWRATSDAGMKRWSHALPTGHMRLCE